ncbi:MAG: virulence RhuM family protein [Paludibacteraceae bacterium]|nr:virulence RhuM family protein [Paludibacteraceae bacterium]
MKTDLQAKQTAREEISLSVNEVSAKEQNQIILYRPNDTISLEVRLENDTVWLSQAQMAELFIKDQSVIARHIKNIFTEEELETEGNMQILHNTISKFKPTTLYSLDVVISVGYRVKSKRGTEFRRWANKVLKEYLLRGYAVNQRINLLEDKIDRKFAEQDAKIEDLNKQVDFFVRTALPPVEGVFHNGQIFDAYKFATDLIKSANKSLVLIDNYIDESVLLMLSKRKPGVSANIYSYPISYTLRQDLQKHNRQYSPINIHNHTTSHDRFLIIDDTEVYHIGASLKDLGKKLFAFSKLNIPPSAIL